MYDVSSTHVSHVISESWRASHLVLAAPTYNMNLYPPMENAIRDMKALNLQNRTVAVMDNGSWANVAGKQMKALLSEMKDMRILESGVSLASSLKENQAEALEALCGEIVSSFNQ